MGTNICGCNNDPEQGNESDVIFKYNIKTIIFTYLVQSKSKSKSVKY